MLDGRVTVGITERYAGILYKEIALSESLNILTYALLRVDFH